LSLALNRNPRSRAVENIDPRAKEWSSPLRKTQISAVQR
jgi:hypothetical protein